MSLMPGDPPPLTDPGNKLLVSGLPSTLQTGLLPGSAGQVAVITIRTPDVTLMLTMGSKDEVGDWIAQLTRLRDQMSSSGLITAASHGQVASLRRPGG